MIIAALIGIVIAIVVGVNLIPLMTGTIDEAKETAEAAGTPITGAESALLDILPYVFVAVVILGAVSWIGMGGSERREKVKDIAIKLVKNPRSLIVSIKKASSSWAEYSNNLDELLGIKTSNVDDLWGLDLTRDNELHIGMEEHDWYIADKSPTEDMFKVVGLHKQDSSKNLVYALGRPGTDKDTILLRLPSWALESDWSGTAKAIDTRRLQQYVAEEVGGRR